LATQQNFWDHCVQFNLPWHSHSASHWLPYVAQYKGRLLAATTLTQKISHINFLTELKPPMLPGPAVRLDKMITGLTSLQLTKEAPKVLPPTFLWRLHNLYQPKPIHIAIQMQTALGLRGGHFMIMKRRYYLSQGVLIPPFKKRLTYTLLPTAHIPPELLRAYLELQPQSATHSSYVLPFWTPAQYKKLFSAATKELGLNRATHSARHTFCTIHSAKGTPRGIVAAYALHKDDKTTNIYVHDLSPEELACVHDHPEYFRTCSMLLTPVAPSRLVN